MGNTPLMQCFTWETQLTYFDTVRLADDWFIQYPVWLNKDKAPESRQIRSLCSEEIQEELTKYTQDFTMKNRNGDTLLHLLIAKVEQFATLPKIFDILIQAPIINAKNNKGNTPLIEVIIIHSL